MIIAISILGLFFLILIIWYFNKEETDDRLAISPSFKEIVTINEINIGLYSEENIENINSIEVNNKVVRIISNLIYNGLFEYNESDVLESKLIADYAKIDEKNYVFKLKSDIVFHNGERLISENIKDTIEKILLNEDSYFINCVDNIQSVKIIDDSMFRINLIEAEDEFQKNLIFPILCDDSNVGTNEYKVKEFAHNKIVLENNKIGQVLNIFICSTLEELYGGFKNKNFDVINSIDGIDYKDYIGEFGYLKKSYKGSKYYYLDFNTDNFFKNSKLKDAVLFGINGEEIVAKVFEGNAYNIKSLDYDLDNVVEILESQRYVYTGEGWYNKEKLLKFDLLLNKNLLTNLEIAYIIKEQLERVGIRIELVIVNEGEYYKMVKNKEYDILLFELEAECYVDEEVENGLFCNKLDILYSPYLSGKITPTINNVFYNINTWKKIVN